MPDAVMRAQAGPGACSGIAGNQDANQQTSVCGPLSPNVARCRRRHPRGEGGDDRAGGGGRARPGRAHRRMRRVPGAGHAGKRLGGVGFKD